MKQTYRWPTKLAKFGITDPFLMILVAKYENEIPWEVENIRDEKGLVDHVSLRMLPHQLKRMTWPPQKGSKHCFITARHVNLTLALQADQEIDPEDMEILELIRQENGDEEASVALAQIVNQRKAKAFYHWETLLTTTYAQNAALCVLLLRPLLDGCGPKSRRTIIPPSDDVVDWLTRRIRNRSLLPSQNIAKVYALKLGSGNQHVPMNGWQYIPQSMEFATRLAAASAGTGWCIGDVGMAEAMLSYSSFYLLRDQGKAVVALRMEGAGCKIVECQGLHNESPSDWFGDIDLFIRSQGLELMSRSVELSHYLEWAGLSDTRPPEWWGHRAKYWPFCLALAPAENLLKTDELEFADYVQYSGFPFFKVLLETCGLSMTTNEWREMMLVDPVRYSSVPEAYKHDPGIVDGCLSGWIQRLQDEQVSLHELKEVPKFVRERPAFNDALQLSFQERLKVETRRRPATRRERLRQFDMGTVLPPSSKEASNLAVERLINKLLRNQTSDFSDRIFPDETRAHKDFLEIRAEAWEVAVGLQPPLWFALPEDLAERPCFKLNEADVSRVNLDAWETKVSFRPWLLTQKAGVPKTIRMHKRILEAYFSAWMEILDSNPMCLWERPNPPRRVYMSYGLLANERTINSMAAIWKRHYMDMFRFWERGSDRMQNMPALQLSVLRAIGGAQKLEMQVSAYRTVKNIDERRMADKGSRPLTLYEEEIERRLMKTGFRPERRHSQPA